jgi:hypothetical protein
MIGAAGVAEFSRLSPDTMVATAVEIFLRGMQVDSWQGNVQGGWHG